MILVERVTSWADKFWCIIYCSYDRMHSLSVYWPSFSQSWYNLRSLYRIQTGTSFPSAIQDNPNDVDDNELNRKWYPIKE